MGEAKQSDHQAHEVVVRCADTGHLVLRSEHNGSLDIYPERSTLVSLGRDEVHELIVLLVHWLDHGTVCRS